MTVVPSFPKAPLGQSERALPSHLRVETAEDIHLRSSSGCSASDEGHGRLFLQALAQELEEIVDLIRNYAEDIYERHSAYLQSEACRQLRFILRGCDQVDQLATWLAWFIHAGEVHQIVPGLRVDALLLQAREKWPQLWPREVEVVVSSGIPPLVGDPESLCRLLMLLVSVGCAGKSGTGWRVAVRPASEDNSALLLRVEVAGGKDETARVGSEPLTPREQMKLALAARIVRAHGGHLRCEDLSGKLRCFVVQLPASEAELRNGCRIPPPHWVGTSGANASSGGK